MGTITQLLVMNVSLENNNKNSNNSGSGNITKQPPAPAYQSPTAEIPAAGTNDPEAQQGSAAVWEKRKANSLADSVRGQIFAHLAITATSAKFMKECFCCPCFWLPANKSAKNAIAALNDANYGLFKEESKNLATVVVRGYKVTFLIFGIPAFYYLYTWLLFFFMIQWPRMLSDINQQKGILWAMGLDSRYEN